MDVLRISKRRRSAATIVAVVTLVTAAGIVTAAPPANASPWPYHFLSRLSYQCLTVLGSPSADGATIGQWSCTGATTQSWYMDRVRWNGNEDVWTIRSQFSGKCMDVAGADYSPGARVIQYTCVSGAPEQEFFDRPVGRTGSGNTISTIHPVAAPHMCLDVQGGNHDYGAPLGLWPCEGAYEQQFIGQDVW